MMKKVKLPLAGLMMSVAVQTSAGAPRAVVSDAVPAVTAATVPAAILEVDSDAVPGAISGTGSASSPAGGLPLAPDTGNAGVVAAAAGMQSPGVTMADTLSASPKKEPWMQRMRERSEAKERSGAFMITPLVGPGYTPEMGFTIAGGVLMSLRTDRSDPALQRSSFPLNIGYGTNGAFFVNSKIATFWFHDQLRVYADVNFKNMKDNYFGIGYESARNTPKGSTTTAYKRLWMQFNPRFMWQFRPHLFAGAGLDLNYTKGKEACDQVAADPTYAKYNDRPFNSGLSANFQYDSRDVAVNAWKGLFAEVAASFYGGYLGSDNTYQIYSVDVRKYIPIVRPGHTLALQVRGRFGNGDVPYGEMSQLGTPFDLRGYLWGEYRDKSMFFAIAEYRHTFYRRNGRPSAHGLVGWVATGSVANSPAAFSYWLPNGGVGYRLQVQPRMNLRLDFGIGVGGQHGFYFNFNEAF